MDNIRMGIILFLLLTALGCRRQNEVETKAVKENAANRLVQQMAKMNVITTFSDQKKKTLSVLYGNSVALENARKQSNPKTGAVLMLVNWKSKVDAEWFGGIVPATVSSLEVLENTENNDYRYSKYQGKDFKMEKNVDSGVLSERRSFILNIKAAIMP